MIQPRTLEELIKLIQPQIPVSVDLWDAKTIGAYLKVAPRRITEHYALLEDFPAPIRLPSATGGHGHPRWKAMDIVLWAEQYQEGKARKS